MKNGGTKNMKIKITKCNNKMAWYFDKIGQVFDVDSMSVRDFYIKEKNKIFVSKCVLISDAEIVDNPKNN